MTTRPLRRDIRLLVINPNSSQEMTDGMERAIRTLDLSPNVHITMYTAPPESPPSINDGEDIEASNEVVTNNLRQTWILDDYDGALVACYSVHWLVDSITTLAGQRFLVTGIFEASILTALPLLQRQYGGTTGWGIVTTGKFWEDHLTAGVKRYLGQSSGDQNSLFLGVHSTGLDAADFHGDISPDIIRGRLKEATRRLLHEGPVQCVVLGCAGMSGLDEIVRSTIREEYPRQQAESVYIIDGVKAGIGILEQMVKNKRMFQDPELPAY
ncbi:Protein dcg1 [Cytospora paraplurivora]|uniref:Protein dcg1 n=1 Tax=Cytospora paraplurivora TaxID=2898453 RepID=A0AAN9UI84_9PEZI